MPLLSKLASVLLVGKSLSTSSILFQRFLSGITALLGLSLLVAILAGALMILGLYVGYGLMVTQGVDEMTALLIIGGVITVLCAGLIALIIRCLRKLRSIPSKIMYAESPLGSRLSSIADAFMDGMTHPAPRRR